ncbi:MAG: AAA family ATPase [Christensenellaceae bacterium]|jgi:energy-coupling factor transporter ATP-binding protein EcfA2|nr:AAA family ATPase [Christensenellaceae bacterium]
MKLLKFRVTDFRSIIDSGWIECQNVTVFAGDNESGKTTLFFALMKLMPANRLEVLRASRADIYRIAEINLKTDVPIDRADQLLPDILSTIFIRAEFLLDDKLNARIKEINHDYIAKSTMVVTKTYAGIYDIDITSDMPSNLKKLVEDEILLFLPKFQYFHEVTEASSNIDLLTLVDKLSGKLKDNVLNADERRFQRLLSCLDIWENNLQKTISEAEERLEIDRKVIDFRDVLEAVPLFHNRIKRGFERLNEQFLECWGKDDTSIGFESYDRGIAIKIIDKKTGKLYNLENRSTGFRRFFAHFLTFSITGLMSKNDHHTILMFDEAGAAMHSITQRKLAQYFLKAGECAQVLYNTHSSYMIPVKQMNNVRVVFKDESGHTNISPDLVINDERSNELSIFPVQSSLGLYVAEKSLAGCLPIIVLNEEDESYLSLIKNILISKGKLNTIYQTLVFSTGKTGIDSICAMFSDNGDLPAVLFASDNEGQEIKQRLLLGKYKTSPDKLLSLGDYLKGAIYIEDIMPINYVELSARLYISEILDKGIDDPNLKFSFSSKTSLISQIYDFVKEKNIVLPKNFRYEISKRTKINVMSFYNDVHIPYRYIDSWTKIWRDLIRLSE